MALTFTTGMTEISDADSVTNWAAYKITAGGGTPTAALDTDIEKEGTGCIGCSPTALKDCGLSFDYYTANSNSTLDLSASGNEVLGIWILCITKSLIDTMANGGLYIITCASNGVPSLTNDWAKWYVAGSNEFKEGWNYFEIDTRKTPSATNGSWSGSSLAAIYQIGAGVVATGSWKTDWFYVDRMAYGRPVYTLKGDGTTTADWNDFLSDSETAVNGLIQDINGAYELSCGIQFGDDAQTATTTFDDDTNQIINFKRHTYYYSGIVDALNYGDYYKISAKGAASYKTSVTLGNLVGSDEGILGGTIRSLSPANVSVDIDFNTDQAHINVLNIYGVTFQGIQGNIDLGNNTTFNYFSCNFIDCDQVDANGGCEIRNCNFIDTPDTNGALLWNSSIDMQKCKFIACTTGPGIEHNTWNGTSSGTSTNSGSETTTLYDSSGSFVTDGVAVNDIIYNETDGSFGRVTNVVSNTELTHTALSGGTNNYWTNGDAYSEATPYSYTDLEFSGNTYDVDNDTSPANVVAISKAGTSNPSSYPSGDFVAIQGSVTVKVTVKDEDGAVIENAQTAVFITSNGTQIMNEDTNASGVASETYAGTTPVEVEVRVRKSSTGATKYIPYSSIQNVLSGTGLTLDVTLREDDNA